LLILPKGGFLPGKPPEKLCSKPQRGGGKNIFRWIFYTKHKEKNRKTENL